MHHLQFALISGEFSDLFPSRLRIQALNVSYSVKCLGVARVPGVSALWSGEEGVWGLAVSQPSENVRCQRQCYFFSEWTVTLLSHYCNHRKTSRAIPDISRLGLPVLQPRRDAKLALVHDAAECSTVDTR